LRFGNACWYHRNGMKNDAVFSEVGIDPAGYDDLHVTRVLHAFVAVSDGHVVKVGEPKLEYCPLVAILHDGTGGDPDPARRRQLVAEMTREKIARFGHFTARREVERNDVAVPYGASEMMMFALRKGSIDCAVTACDGAGTVICDTPGLVQGVGARMNGLFYTSPVPATIGRIEAAGGGHVPFADTASIDQAGGVRRAAELGHRRIAVTVNGYLGGDLAAIREVEAAAGLSVTLIVVCTTGAGRPRVEEIRDHADLVWSCASEGIREVVGSASVIQVSSGIPVFAVTGRGVRFLACYSPNEDVFARLDPGRQYLIAGNARGTPIRMGNMKTSIAEARLPVRSAREPRPLTE
jgi:putative methanogenesis marker protein 8